MLSYNGIELKLLKTDMVVRQPNWSDDDTTYKWTDFTISVSCIYNAAATSYVTLGQQYGSLPPTTDGAIRHFLTQPRRPLFYSEAGEAIISLPALFQDGSTIDENNGPIPLFLNITRITPSTFYVTFSVKCSIIECPPGGIPDPIASSRYSVSESINKQFLSTMTRSGITYFRSNVLAIIGDTPDDYRSYIIPALLLGYKRTQLDFGLSSDGLRIDWSVIDEEQIQDIGDPSVPGSAGSIGITDMGLTYHVGNLIKSSLGLASLGSICTVNTWAIGQKGANRYSMLLFLFTVILDKLANVILFGVPSSCEVSEDIFLNRIDVQISYVCVDDGAALAGLALPLNGVIGQQILSLPNLSGVNRNLPLGKGTRGTAGYYLATSNFATACYTSYTTVGQDPTATLIPPDAYDNNPQRGVGPTIKGYYAPAAPSQLNYPINPPVRQRGFQSVGVFAAQTMYTKYEVFSHYITSKGIITIPKTITCSTDQNNPNYQPDCNPVSCVNIQLFQPVTMKVVEFSIERIGAVPEVPNPAVNQTYKNGQINPYYGNYTLKSSTISTIGNELMADGFTQVYRITGVFNYSCINPLNDNAKVPFDLPPWVGVLPSIATQVSPNNYEDGIINLPVS